MSQSSAAKAQQRPTGAGEHELSEIAALIAAAGYSDRVRIDKTVVRGLEYYTGPVYEVELTFEIKDEKGRPVRFGSVGGGGRYDGLVSRFRGEPVPATGFSIGVSRLQAALTALGKISAKPEPGPVVVTIFDRDRVADYQKMAATLRNAGIRAELYLGNPKNNLGAQLKYADKRGSPCAIIQGGDEKARGEVQIKDLILGATLAETKDREEYLKKQAEAQFAVKEDCAGRRRAQAARPPQAGVTNPALTAAAAARRPSSGSRARSSSCHCPSSRRRASDRWRRVRDISPQWSCATRCPARHLESAVRPAASS